MLRQVTIESFDWGSLMRMRQVEPRLPLVALDNHDFLQVGQPGASPWLGGIDIDDFGGDPLKTIKSFGASAWSPVHGAPQNGKVTDPGYVPYVPSGGPGTTGCRPAARRAPRCGRARSAARRAGRRRTPRCRTE
jgi:hypothetical protein